MQKSSHRRQKHEDKSIVKNKSVQLKKKDSDDMEKLVGDGSKSNNLAQLQSIADQHLIQKKEQQNGDTIQLYRNGYAPRIMGNANNANGAYSYDTFTRPSNFYQSTINAVYAQAQQQTAQNPITRRQEVYYRCPNCQNWMTYEAFHIGHIETWQDYVRDTQPANVGEARDAYNDLDNLQLECSSCNTSHAFEEDYDDEMDDDDDFIDDSEFDKKENDKAFKDLRKNVLPKFQSTGFMGALNSGKYNK